MTDSPITVRQATMEDHAFLVQGNLAMAFETEGKHIDPATVSKGVRAVLDNPEHGLYLLACRDGQTVGQLMLTYEWSDWRNGRFAWIQSVYVVPQARRSGVFRALFSFLKDRAASTPEWIGFRLYVEKHNETAKAVYRALGMTETHYDLYEWMRRA